MVFSWLLASSLCVVASGNIAGDYCKVLVEYETFKAQLDTYFASRNEVCDGMHIRTGISEKEGRICGLLQGLVYYREGFGNLTGEFWLGNEYIHRITAQGNYSLRVDMTSKTNIKTYAEYSYFNVGNMSDFYNLTVSGYSGNARDKMTYHNKMRFSARNLDLDTSSKNCAQEYKGGWWYKSGYHSNLNGVYGATDSTGIKWYPTVMKRTTMKIRPI